MGNSATSKYLYCLNNFEKDSDFNYKGSNFNLKTINGAKTEEQLYPNHFPLDVIDLAINEEDGMKGPLSVSSLFQDHIKLRTDSSTPNTKIDSIIYKNRVVRIQRFYRNYKSLNITVESASTSGNVNHLINNTKLKIAPKLYTRDFSSNTVNPRTKTANRSSFSRKPTGRNSETILLDNRSIMNASSGSFYSPMHAKISSINKPKDCFLIRSRLKSSNKSFIGSIAALLKEDDEFGMKEYSNGSTLVGLFNSKNKKINGIGYYFQKPTQIYFKGQFLNNQMNGFGFVDGNAEFNYEGEWKMNIKNGIGLEKWVNGSYYEGEFAEGLKQGIGTFVWENGAKYIGEWFQNKMNGQVSKYYVYSYYLQGHSDI